MAFAMLDASALLEIETAIAYVDGLLRMSRLVARGYTAR